MKEKLQIWQAVQGAMQGGKGGIPSEVTLLSCNFSKKSSGKCHKKRGDFPGSLLQEIENVLANIE